MLRKIVVGKLYFLIFALNLCYCNIGSQSAGNKELEKFVQSCLKKVVQSVAKLEFGPQPEWSWAVTYINANFESLLTRYGLPEFGSVETRDNRLNLVQTCLDEFGYGNSEYCEEDLINHFAQEISMSLVTAMLLAQDIAESGPAEVAIINDSIFENEARRGFLWNVFCPILTLKYFLPKSTYIMAITTVITNLFMEGDSDKSFTFGQDEFVQFEKGKARSQQKTTTTAFTQEEQILQYFSAMDLNKDGQLSYFEFIFGTVCTVQNCFESTQPPQNQITLADQMKAADKNKDGVLSLTEFSSGVQSLTFELNGGNGNGGTVENLEDVFDLFDMNNDDSVSFVEIDAILQGIQFPPPPPQQNIATHGHSVSNTAKPTLVKHGALTKEDMTNLAKTLERKFGHSMIDVEGLMLILDKNFNGLIDVNEQELIASYLHFL